MRRTLFVVLLAVLSLGFVRAQRQPYRVVFDLTSRDTLEQKAYCGGSKRLALRVPMRRWKWSCMRRGSISSCQSGPPTSPT